MNKLYRRLAAVNIRNNRQFYLPYLLTGIVSAAMFYLMISMTNNPGLDQVYGGRDIRMVLRLGTGIVGFFSCIFLFYTNSFIIKRRKKELGVYNILGMEKKHISVVLTLEMLFTAITTVGGGLVVGITFNKLLTMLLIRMTGLRTSIPFYISWSGCACTAVLFGLIYLAALAFNLMQIKLANPIELLHSGNSGEREPKTKIFMTVLGLICLGSGYYIAITTTNAVEAFGLFFVAVILVMIGTYFLFTSGSIAFLKLLRKNKNYYYKTRHFTTVSGMIYRMKQNAVGLANICILSTMVLVTVSTTTGMYVGIEDELNARYPAEINATVYYSGVPVQRADIGTVITTALKNTGRTVMEKSDVMQFSYTASEQEGSLKTGTDMMWAEYNASDMAVVTVMTREDYEKFSGESIAAFSGDELAVAAEPFYEREAIEIEGQEYRVCKNYTYPENGTNVYSMTGNKSYYIIVSDEQALEDIFQRVAAELTTEQNPFKLHHVLEFDIDGTPEEKLAAEEAVSGAVEQWEAENSSRYPEWKSIYLENRQQSHDSFFTLYGSLFFLGLFLGIMFLMVTVLIIFYKQISEGYEDKERFAIMQKVGMSNLEVKRAIRSQILTVFFLPLVVAVIHVAAAFPMITRILSIMNLVNIPLIVMCLAGTALVFGVIYMAVFWLTSRSYYKIVGNQISR